MMYPISNKLWCYALCYILVWLGKKERKRKREERDEDALTALVPSDVTAVSLGVGRLICSYAPLLSVFLCPPMVELSPSSDHPRRVSGGGQSPSECSGNGLVGRRVSCCPPHQMSTGWVYLEHRHTL